MHVENNEEFLYYIVNVKGEGTEYFFFISVSPAPSRSSADIFQMHEEMNTTRLNMSSS